MTQPKEGAEGPDARHPIQIVSKRTGISADVLRAWEKRYEAVTPTRSESGRRLYSDEDIERLTLLRLLTEGGRRIGDIAPLALPKLLEMADEDGLGESGEGYAASAPPSAPRPYTEEDRPHLSLAREALLAADARELERILALAATELSTPVVLHDVGEPLLRDVGVRWRSGDRRLDPEQILALGMRLLFGGRATFRLAEPGAPVAVFAGWGSSRAELESLLAGTAAGIAGWRALAAERDADVETLLGLLRKTRAEKLVVAIAGLAGDDARSGWLGALRERLPRDVALFALGTGAPAEAALAKAARVRCLDGLGALVDALGSPAP